MRILLSAVALAAASPAVLADAPDSSTSEPSTVVVTAQRLNEARSTIETQTGASTYTIDSEAIVAMPGG